MAIILSFIVESLAFRYRIGIRSRVFELRSGSNAKDLPSPKSPRGELVNDVSSIGGRIAAAIAVSTSALSIVSSSKVMAVGITEDDFINSLATCLTSKRSCHQF